MENIDWGNLPFGYMKTDCNVRSYYKDGQWSKPEVVADETITLHMAATCLHYGQEAFEGLKAFRCKDGKIRIFRMDENARRMANTAGYTLMAPPPVELFCEMVIEVVRRNERFIPPYGSGASLYIRPLLIGTGAQVGVKPSTEYMLLMFVTPVGPYYKDGFKPINVIVEREYDRAAPRGTGHVKVGGNYAASLLSADSAHAKGYPSVLYLDSAENKYIDECGAANFFGIKEDTYVTPSSKSVLPSITNKSLMVIAQDLGLEVEARRIPLEELSSFEEAGSCGTAAVITPVGKIFDPATDRAYTFGDGSVGPWTQKLYDRLRAIQYGDYPDTHGWVTVL